MLVLSTSRERTSVPQTHWKTALNTNASPIDMRISCRKPACLRRIGPHIVRSNRTPSSAVASIAQKMPTTSGAPQVTFTR